MNINNPPPWSIALLWLLCGLAYAYVSNQDYQDAIAAHQAAQTATIAEVRHDHH